MRGITKPERTEFLVHLSNPRIWLINVVCLPNNHEKRSVDFSEPTGTTGRLRTSRGRHVKR